MSSCRSLIDASATCSSSEYVEERNLHLNKGKWLFTRDHGLSAFPDFVEYCVLLALKLL